MMAEYLGMDDVFLDATVRSLIENSYDMVFVKDMDHVYRMCSKSFALITGNSDVSGVIGKRDEDLFKNPTMVAKYLEDDETAIRNGHPFICHSEPIQMQDGTRRYASTTKGPLKDAKGNIVGVYGISRDITYLYDQQQSYKRELGYLFRLPTNGLYALLIDVEEWRLVDSHTSEQMQSLQQHYDLDVLLKLQRKAIVDGPEALEFYENFTRESIKTMYETGNRMFSFEYEMRLPSGNVRWVQQRLHMLTDPMTSHLGILAILTDINDHKIEEQELMRAAQFDALTGLFNRATCMRNMEKSLSLAHSSQLDALFIVDVDNLKRINDTLGHPTGDSVLQKFSRQFLSVFNGKEILGRIGGDEFLILMRDTTIEKVYQKAEKLVLGLQSVYNRDTEIVPVSASIGISLSDGGAKSLDKLYQEADQALYEAKSNGKNQYQIHDEGLPDLIKLSFDQQQRNAESLNLFQVLNYLDVGIVIYRIKFRSKETNFLFISDTYMRMMGITSREQAMDCYTRSNYEYIHPEDRDRVRNGYLEAIAQVKSFSTVFRRRREDGSYLWVSANHRVTKTADGDIDDFAVYTDISKLKEVEFSLHEKNHIIEMALDNSDIGLWFFDIKSNKCIMTSNSMRNHSQTQPVLENYPECLIEQGLVHPTSISDVRNLYETICSGVQQVRGEIWLKSPDNDGWWCEQLSITILKDANGEPAKAVGIGKDITALKRNSSSYLLYQGHHPRKGTDVAFCRLDLTAGSCLEGYVKSPG